MKGLAVWAEIPAMFEHEQSTGTPNNFLYYPFKVEDLSSECLY